MFTHVALVAQMHMLGILNAYENCCESNWFAQNISQLYYGSRVPTMKGKNERKKKLCRPQNNANAKPRCRVASDAKA